MMNYNANTTDITIIISTARIINIMDHMNVLTYSPGFFGLRAFRCYCCFWLGHTGSIK